MNLSTATLMQLTATAVALLAIGLALTEWGRLSGPAIDSGRLPGLRWASAALLLIGVMAAMQGLAFGAAVAWGFLTGGGILLLIQALGVPFLVQAGGYWASLARARPYRLRRLGWRLWPWRWLAAAWMAMIAWTGLLMFLFPHRFSSNLFEILRLDKMPAILQWPFLVALVTLAPILEEILFRHYLLYRIAALLGRLRGAAVPVAIALCSLLWSVGHWGAIDPYWLKLVQTLVLGCILGATAWRRGMDAAIALHWVYNLSLIPLSLLIRV